MNNSISVTPIGWVESVFTEKFGTPRQSGVVPSATGVLHFYPPYDQPEAFEELSGFSHLWLITQFHLIPEDAEFRPRVRPPKLGGEKKVGVFASRAPYRPNRLCLTKVRLEGIINESGSVSLKISGLDLVNETPILDVKPYLPYADSSPEVTTSFGLPPQDITVEPENDKVFADLTPEHIVLITETLQAQPQPAYAREDQSFGLSLAKLNIRWSMSGKKIVVNEVS